MEQSNIPKKSPSFSLPAKFRKLPIEERLMLIQSLLETEDIDLNEIALGQELIQGINASSKLADTMIESAIGIMPLPLGIVSNLLVDATVYHVPIATEEPSVIAAANYAAKIFANASNTGLITQVKPPLQIVQIALAQVSEEGKQKLLQSIPTLHSSIMGYLASMQKRGGGIRRIELRRLKNNLLIMHIIIDVRDAMGANIANTTAEFIAPTVVEISEGQLLSAILSNYSEERLVHAHIALDIHKLPIPQHSKISDRETIAKQIEQMSLWAEEDIYRATTHNKGIMNGVSGFSLATGNDTRAMEAAAHALAGTISTLISSPFCRESIFHKKNLEIPQSPYNPLSIWRYDEANKCLEGTITLPALLASVGGSTNHPVAQWTKNLLGLHHKKNTIHAHTLNRIAAALGLAQNFAALLALVTQGIQHGHMPLHNKKK